MQKLIGFLKLIRAGNLLIAALSLSLFYYLIIIPVHTNTFNTTLLPFTNTEFILFIISVALVAAGGNVINDYYDFEPDKEYKPNRPLAKGLMSLDAAMYLHMALALAGIMLGFYLGWLKHNIHLGYLYIISAVLLFVYSAFLKKVPLAGNILVAGLSAFVFVLLLIFEANFLRVVHADMLIDNKAFGFTILISQMKFYASFAFLTSFARELVKDIEDYEGDAAYSITTFAVDYGINAAKALTVLILVSLLCLLAYCMNNFIKDGAVKDTAYLLLAVALPVLAIIALIIIARVKTDYSRISALLKVVMLLGILSIPAFYFIHQTQA